MAQESMVTVNWSSASVDDGVLTVELEGDPTEEWHESFHTTAKLLGGSGWGDPELDGTKVRVPDLTPGLEDKLRAFLEGVVLQANSTQDAEEDEPEQDEGSTSESDDEDGSSSEPDSDSGSGSGSDSDDSDDSDEPGTPDDEMAERFRGFGSDA